MPCIQRFLHFFDHFSSLVLQISLHTRHFFAIFFSKNDREIEPVVLHTINPMNSTKWVTSFSWIFHFSLIDFSKKIFEIFFHKCQMPWGYVELGPRSKKEKNFVEFIGFMVCKTTSSISRSFLLKTIVSRYICKTSGEKLSKKCKNL